MLHRPRPVTLAAIGLLIGMHAATPDPGSIHPSDAASFEGQRVRLQGLVMDSRNWGDGARSVVMQDGAGIVVHHEGAPVDLGVWVEAEGDMQRTGGELRLYGSLSVTRPPATLTTPLSALAAAPEEWVGRPVHVRGEASRDFLRDGPHRIHVGDGPWIEGWVEARGTLGYDASCICYRLHAQAVWPWT